MRELQILVISLSWFVTLSGIFTIYITDDELFIYK